MTWSEKVIGGDESALREFVYTDALAFAVAAYSRVYIGQLPPGGFEIDLPMPEGASIIGSVPRDNGGEILIRASASCADTLQFYDRALPAANWQPVEDNPPGFGFGERRFESRRYCNEAAQAELQLHVSDVEDGSCIRIFVIENHNPCHPRRYGFSMNVIPNLQTPPGAKLMPSGRGFGSGSGMYGYRHAYSTASLFTEMSAAELAAAYHDQLKAKGWTLVSAETGEHMACSTWTVTHEDVLWSGFVTVAPDPIASKTYTAAIYVYEGAG